MALELPQNLFCLLEVGIPGNKHIPPLTSSWVISHLEREHPPGSVKGAKLDLVEGRLGSGLHSLGDALDEQGQVSCSSPVLSCLHKG